VESEAGSRQRQEEARDRRQGSQVDYGYEQQALKQVMKETQE
jgi:hypothetical protein